MRVVKSLLLAALLAMPFGTRAAQFAVSLNPAKGISSILYGTDTHNYVASNSTVPVFRAGFNGSTKTYQPITQAAVSTTTNPNDTLTLVDSGSKIAKVVIQAKPGNDFLELDFTVTNLNSQTITEWDLKALTWAFKGSPSWDGTSGMVFPKSVHAWDTDAALEKTFTDTAQTLNPWQCWFSDIRAIHASWCPNTYPGTWDIYFSPDAAQPSPYSEFPTAAGQSLSWNLKIAYSASKPDSAKVAPGAYSVQAKRRPMMVNNTFFSQPCKIIGGNWFGFGLATNPANNPNYWFADPSLNLYDVKTGKLLASEGDYSGLNQLAQRMIGRVHWCNAKTIAAGGIGVIHWDWPESERYPQPGISYIGDPRVAPILCPELYYTNSKFPVSVYAQVMAEMDSDGVTHHKGWLWGVGLRASVFHPPPPYGDGPKQITYSSLNQGVQDLIGKVSPMYQAGARLFYVDSFGPYPVNNHPEAYAAELLRQVQAQYPDALFIPECYSRADIFSAGFPWRDRQPSISTSSGSRTSPQAHIIWPGARAAVRWENKGNISMIPGTPNYSSTVQLIQSGVSVGDWAIANAFSGIPTEVEQIGAIYHLLGH